MNFPLVHIDDHFLLMTSLFSTQIQQWHYSIHQATRKNSSEAIITYNVLKTDRFLNFNKKFFAFTLKVILKSHGLISEKRFEVLDVRKLEFVFSNTDCWKKSLFWFNTYSSFTRLLQNLLLAKYGQSKHK